MSTIWEIVEQNSNLKISRLKVPGGWIYDYDCRSIFVPEPVNAELIYKQGYEVGYAKANSQWIKCGEVGNQNVIDLAKSNLQFKCIHGVVGYCTACGT